MSQPQLLQIKLSRFDAQPWGFRLQGGVDFASPLLVQKVNGGSLAEQAGLMPGDSVIKINDVDVFNLRHKEAQDVVVRSGNNFVMTVQRGGSTWRPQVTPTGQLPQPNSPYLQTVTKTSLAHKQLESQHVGCGYNNAAKPFAQGGDGSVKSIVNKQYNSPVGIYSDESIAETLSAQAEVLAGGVLGVNFKKNEKEYHAEKSEVLKLLREEESGKSTPVTCVEAAASSTSNFYWTHSHAIGGNERRSTSVSQKQHDERIGTTLQHQTLAPAATHRPSLPATTATQPGNKFEPIDEDQSGGSEAASAGQPDPRLIVMPVCPALQTPEYKAELEAAAAAAAQDGGPRPLSAGGHPACQMCGVGIVGVFVRIKDKNLHVECFKCATCGTSLKNQGYYNFNNKLYCDIHAKLAALQNPPAGTEGYVPVPIKPNTKLSASTISSALNAHGYNGVVNGNSGTPTPASQHEDNSIVDLPLPPPPSPTQLQQYENQTYLNTVNITTEQQQQQHQRHNQHTRTHSSLSSLSTGSNITNSSQSLSPIPYNCNQQQHNETTASTLSLDRFGSSPIHSRQTSSSSSSLGYGGGGTISGCSGNGGGGGLADGSNYISMPPAPPPPPLTVESDNGLCMNSLKQHHNNSNTKLLQKQNEYELNVYNKSYDGPQQQQQQQQQHLQSQQQQPQQQPITQKVYNKFLKEYSNKLLTQHNDTNTIGSNNNSINSNNSRLKQQLETKNHNINTYIRNESPKPFISPSLLSTPSPTNNTSVAAMAASLNNQLKFDSCQVVAPNASTSVLVSSSQVDKVRDSINSNCNSHCTTITNATNEMSTTMATMPSNITSADNGDKPFEYVTLTGNVIRSVVPPGKGANVNYKVSQGYVRPFGATPAATTPKSSVIYPPQPQQWSASAPPPAQPKPISNPYATLPRSNVGQQGRKVQSMYHNSNNYSSNYATTQYKKTPNPGANRFTVMPVSYNKQFNYKNNYYNKEPALKMGNIGGTLPNRKSSNALNSSKGKHALPTKTETLEHIPAPDDEATVMLSESIGKMNMGTKTNNFMIEAGKVISDMLEARLANGGPPLQSKTNLNSLSNNTSTSSRSPLVVRKRLDLDDFKDINPTEPAVLKPVGTLQQTLERNPKLNEIKVEQGLTQGINAEQLLTSHPMNKALDMCDNKSKPLSPNNNAEALQPSASIALTNADALPHSETVIYRNNGGSNRRASHATDRRSYIENNTQQNCNNKNDYTQDDSAFSICVKALGKDGTNSDRPMSAENEEVVSQLLKDGKRPMCCQCNKEITTGPFITALGRIWCPEHFICVNANCRRALQDIGFVEEKGDLYCEYCFEKYLAPTCSKCGNKIKGDCLNAIGKHFHPECFNCAHCGKLFGNTPFFLEDGNPYCEADWNELFTTKCFACGFPVEAGDRWVEALNHNYHSQCFNCTYCKQNLEGQSFYNKGGRPFCKNHAR